MKKLKTHPKLFKSILILNNKATVKTKWAFYKKLIKLSFFNKIYYPFWK